MTLTLGALLLAFTSVSTTADVKCPIDQSGSYFTGKTQTDRATGKLLKQYKCYRNAHLCWTP